MNWIKIFSPAIMEGPDFIKELKLPGKKLCIIKDGDKIFAVQNKCPHAGASLSAGWCTNGSLVCPYHRHEFSLETGRGKASQGNYLETYPVDIRKDGIYVGLKNSWWKFW